MPKKIKLSSQLCFGKFVLVEVTYLSQWRFMRKECRGWDSNPHRGEIPRDCKALEAKGR
jgi:hypothetical protein